MGRRRRRRRHHADVLDAARVGNLSERAHAPTANIVSVHVLILPDGVHGASGADKRTRCKRAARCGRCDVRPPATMDRVPRQLLTGDAYAVQVGAEDDQPRHHAAALRCDAYPRRSRQRVGAAQRTPIDVARAVQAVQTVSRHHDALHGPRRDRRPSTRAAQAVLPHMAAVAHAIQRLGPFCRRLADGNVAHAARSRSGPAATAIGGVAVHCLAGAYAVQKPAMHEDATCDRGRCAAAGAGRVADQGSLPVARHVCALAPDAKGIANAVHVITQRKGRRRR